VIEPGVSSPRILWERACIPLRIRVRSLPDNALKGLNGAGKRP